MRGQMRMLFLMKRNFFDKIIKRNKYECSNCGVTEYYNTNYCPVCGAVMKLVLK